MKKLINEFYNELTDKELQLLYTFKSKCVGGGCLSCVYRNSCKEMTKIIKNEYSVESSTFVSPVPYFWTDADMEDILSQDGDIISILKKVEF